MTTAPRKRIRIKTRATTPEALVLGLRGLVDLRGFFVRGAPSLPIGAPVALELMLADGSRVLRGEGVVDGHVADGPRAGMGLALGWDVDSRAWLERFSPPSVAKVAPAGTAADEPDASTRPEASASPPAPRAPTAEGTASRALPPLPSRLASGVARRNTSDLALRFSTGDLALAAPTPTADLARRTSAPTAPGSTDPFTERGAAFAPSPPLDTSRATPEPLAPGFRAPPVTDPALPSLPASWPAEAVTPAVVHPWEASDVPLVEQASLGAPGASGVAVSRSPELPIEPLVVFEAAELAVLDAPARERAVVPPSGHHAESNVLMPFALAPDPSFASDPRIALAAPKADPLEALSIVDPVWSDLPAEAPSARDEDVRAEAWSEGVVLDVALAAPAAGVPAASAEASTRPAPRVSVDLARWVEPETPKKGGVIGWLKRAFSSE
jgi:hypothetical protein